MEIADTHRECDARPFNVEREGEEEGNGGGAEASGQRMEGLFVERIFSAHPLAGITARINSQQKYARYFRWPDENTYARARAHADAREPQKGNESTGRVCPVRCATRVLLSDRARAPNIRRDESSPPGRSAAKRAALCCLRPDTATLLIASPRSPATDDEQRGAITD